MMWFLIIRKPVVVYAFLMIIINNNLNWTEHVKTLFHYLRTALRSLYHLRKLYSVETLTMVYYGLFHSKLQNGSVVYGCAYKMTIQRLYNFQQGVIRRICGVNCLSQSYPLFRQFNFLLLRSLFYFKVLQTLLSERNIFLQLMAFILILEYLLDPS